MFPLDRDQFQMLSLWPETLSVYIYFLYLGIIELGNNLSQDESRW